jgi:hypothetical protein
VTESATNAVNTVLSQVLSSSALVDVEKLQQQLPYKKAEDMITSNLMLLGKVLRGIADITGDKCLLKEGNPYDLPDCIATGREGLLALISVEDRQYLSSYRTELLLFLSNVYCNLSKLKKETNLNMTGDDSSLLSSAAVSSPSTTSSVYKGLRDSLSIVKQWSKLLFLTVTRYNANLKQPDELLSTLKYQKELDSAVLHQTVYKTMKRKMIAAVGSEVVVQGESNDSLSFLTNMDYWKFHDRCSSWFALRVYGQHAKRSSIYSYQVLRQIIVFSSSPESQRTGLREEKDPILRCLDHLLSLSTHEYDLIGTRATKTFTSIVNHFHFVNLNYVLEKKIFAPFIAVAAAGSSSPLSVPTSLPPLLSYHQLVSTLEFIGNSSILYRWANKIELKTALFSSLSYIQQSIGAITDLEKRELTLLMLTDCFSAYSISWVHSSNDLRQFHLTLFPIILNYFRGNSFTESSGDPAEDGDFPSSSNGSNSSSGMRFDAFYGFLLLHILDTSLYSFSSSQVKDLWSLVLSFFLSWHNSPVQYLGEAMLIKMFEGFSHLSFSSMGGKKESADPSLLAMMKDLFSPSQLNWSKFLLGLAKCRAVNRLSNSGGMGSPNGGGGDGDDGNDDGVAGWSAELTNLLNSSEYCKIVKTRFQSGRFIEYNLTSDWFNKELSLAFFSFFSILQQSSTTEEEIKGERSIDESKYQRIDDIFISPSSLESFLSTAFKAPQLLSNEKEKRAWNLLISEFFCALLRFYMKRRVSESKDESVKKEEHEAFDKVFLNFLFLKIDNCHLEYVRDWQEGISLALEDVVFIDELTSFHFALLERFSLSLQSNPFSSFPLASTSIDTSASSASYAPSLSFSSSLDGEKHLDEMEARSSGASLDGNDGMVMDGVKEGKTKTRTDLFPSSHSGSFSLPSASATATATATQPTAMTLDEGFNSKSKIFMLVFALLNGDCISRVTSSNPLERPKKLDDLLVAKEILSILLSPSTNLLNPYQTSRYEFASILNTLLDFVSYYQTKNETTIASSVSGFYQNELLNSLIEKIVSPAKTSIEQHLSTMVNMMNGVFTSMDGSELMEKMMMMMPDSFDESITLDDNNPNFMMVDGIAERIDEEMKDEGEDEDDEDLDVEGEEMIQREDQIEEEVVQNVSTARYEAEDVMDVEERVRPESATAHLAMQVPMNIDDTALPPLPPTPSYLSPNSPFPTEERYALAARGGVLQKKKKNSSEYPPSSPSSLPPPAPVVPPPLPSIAPDGLKYTIPSVGSSLGPSFSRSRSNDYSSLGVGSGPVGNSSGGIKRPRLQRQQSREEKQFQAIMKQTIDTMIHILRDLVRWIPMTYIHNILITFFPIILHGVIHSEVEIINKSAESVVFIMNSLFPSLFYDENEFLYSQWLEMFETLYDRYSFSWKVKAMILQSCNILITNHWFLLGNNLRSRCKDLFLKGIQETSQLNVRGIASAGMMSYLTYKTPLELQELAELYTRNSEKLAQR